MRAVCGKGFCKLDADELRRRIGLVSDLSIAEAAAAEAILEWIRLREFPGKPSRFGAVFACRTLAHARQFGRQYREGPLFVYQVELGAPVWYGNLAVRARWQKVTRARQHWWGFYTELARAYWDGFTRVAPTAGWVELLAYGPVVVRQEVAVIPPLTKRRASLGSRRAQGRRVQMGKAADQARASQKTYHGIDSRDASPGEINRLVEERAEKDRSGNYSKKKAKKN